MPTQNRFYSNIANITTLNNTSGLFPSDTTMALVSTTGWPTSFPFIARIEPDTSNEELVLVTAGLGTLATPYTITRAYDGTSAKTHAKGVTVEHGFSQIDFQEPQLHLNLTGSSSGAHGLPSSAWLGGTEQLISSQVLASSGTFTFSSIPNTFNHLRIYLAAVSNDSGGVGFSDVGIQFNNDTSTDYSYHFMYLLNSTTVQSSSVAAVTAGHAGFVPNGGLNPTSSSGVGIVVIEIPFYSLASFSKNVTWESHASSGVGAPNNFQTGQGGAIWGNNTAAISTIKLSPANSPNTFTTGSRAFLYGLL
jgi:hypothetical protein